jgi:hypothetical protein
VGPHDGGGRLQRHVNDGRGRPLDIDAPRAVSDTFPSGIHNRGDTVGSADRGAASIEDVTTRRLVAWASGCSRTSISTACTT